MTSVSFIEIPPLNLLFSNRFSPFEILLLNSLSSELGELDSDYVLILSLDLVLLKWSSESSLQVLALYENETLKIT